jgi:hypothetical protein
VIPQGLVLSNRARLRFLKDPKPSKSVMSGNLELNTIPPGRWIEICRPGN